MANPALILAALLCAFGHPADAADAELATATFAGGCFWCMEPPFDETDGVISTTVGYTGGTETDPTYADVSAGETGHAEAVRIVYDPARVTYTQLLKIFWINIDPTVSDRQFCDVGTQYRTAVFYHDAEQERAARKSKKELEDWGGLGRPVLTQVVEATAFYTAELYHQDYYRNNPLRYRFYRYRCGRDQRLEELWGSAPTSTGTPPADRPSCASSHRRSVSARQDAWCRCTSPT